MGLGYGIVWKGNFRLSWSLRLGRVFGIDLYLHWTFLLLLGLIFLFQLGGDEGLAGATGSLLFLIALFTCVVLHELGHALMARRFGVPTLDITLLPIGGVARLVKIPEKPSEELLVALAGPAVNVVIAVIISAFLFFYGGFALLLDVSPASLLGAPFLLKLFAVNVALVVFNLVPAFPMDGGRVLRALLAYHLDYVQSTWIAARVGQGIALLFGLLGILAGGWQLVFIALFVYFAAQAEARMVQWRYGHGGAMRRQPIELLFPRPRQRGHPTSSEEVYEVSPDGKTVRRIWVNLDDPVNLTEALRRRGRL